MTGIYPDGTSTRSAENPLISKSTENTEAHVTFYVDQNGISIHVDANVGIRGAQIEFANVENDPDGIMIETELGQGYYYYVTSDKLLRTLFYDPAGQKQIEPGNHNMAEMRFIISNPDQISIDKLILVDENREKILNLLIEIVLTNETLPTSYLLYQNYPNPFNPNTTVEFDLPEDVSNLNLSIYNALGEKVAELVNASLAAGKYRYQWNAQNLAYGVYIYEIRTNNFNSVKKMMLLK